ncbi:hypothetical protein ACFU7D_19510 [Nocardioides sp. NPDC057577]|uniref:hypothetical protein n=1 Tax=Nocardioides sp. NPDC057577 TaxID=3346171 RepID=UPI00366A5C19
MAEQPPPGRPPPVDSPSGQAARPKGIRARWWLIVFLVGGPLFGAAAVGLGADDDVKSELGWALVVTTMAIAVFLYFFDRVGKGVKDPLRGRYGFLEATIGADGRVSTSKTVVWLWTIIFAATLLFLSCVTFFGDLSADEAFGTDWDAYLLLLGGPFASAVAAKAITVGKAGGETGTKAPTEAATGAGQTTTSVTAKGEPNLADAVMTDTGETSLADSQYVVFTFVAIAYFVGALITNVIDYALGNAELGLPAIPNALLGLTSLAALTYVGAKAAAKEGVGVMDMFQNPIVRGAELTIVLVNVPENVSTIPATVQFAPTGGGAVQTFKAPLTKDRAAWTLKLRARIPVGFYQVTVTTAAGTTPPVTLEVVAAP